MTKTLIVAAITFVAIAAPSAAQASTRVCSSPPAGVHALVVSGTHRATCFASRILARRYRDDGAVAHRVTRYRGASGARITCTRVSRDLSTGDFRISCLVAYTDGARARVRFAIEP